MGGEDCRRRSVPQRAESVREESASEAEIRSLCEEILDRYEEVTLVHRLCERLGSVLGEDRIAQAVLDDGARVLSAACGEVWIRTAGSPRVAAIYPAAASPPVGEGDPLVSAVMEGGSALTLDASDGSEARVAVPLPDPGGAPIGCLVLRGRSEGRSFRAGDVKLLTVLATLASSFIRNSRLSAEVREAEKRRREDEIARQIHLRLLPRKAPSFEGIQIAGGYRPAEHIGGDYFAYLPMDGGRLGLAMADVSGHGVGAALYMAAAKGAIQSEARRTLHPAEILSGANDVLAADFSESDVFATAVFVLFHAGGGAFDVSVAGHPQPLLLRAGGRAEWIDRRGLALGVFDRTTYEETRCSFEAGDVLVVYTDGLVEARGPGRDPFGAGRLVEAARLASRGGADEIRERILFEMARHCGEVPPADDVTLVVVKAVAVRTGGLAS